MVRRVQVHEHELELPLRPLQRLHEPLGDEIRAGGGLEVPLEGRNEGGGLGGGGGDGDEAVVGPGAGVWREEAEEVEGAGEDAAGDPEPEADGARDEADAAGDNIEGEGHELPGEGR